MNEPEKILCIGGPLAGDRVSNMNHPGYAFLAMLDVSYYVHDEISDEKEVYARLEYGYEQHCKAVAERNRPKHFAEQFQQEMQEETKIRDGYTASFLRSCKTVVIANPFEASPVPLTLSYGKHHLGSLNNSLEFEARGEGDKNCGRITVIAIIP